MIAIPSKETNRLTLRTPMKSDLPAMDDYLSKDRISFIDGPLDDVGTWRTLLASLGHWHLRGFGFWHIEYRESGEMAGAVGFLHHFDWPAPELGWNVHHNFEGKGVAYEAAPAVRRYGENHLNINGMVSFIEPTNTHSAALAKRLGAAFEKSHCLSEHECQVYRHPVGDPSKKATQSETNQ